MYYFQLHWFNSQHHQSAAAISRVDEIWPHGSKFQMLCTETASRLISQQNTEESSTFGANLNEKIPKAILLCLSGKLRFFTPPWCIITGSNVRFLRSYCLLPANQNIHTSSCRRKSPAPPGRERDAAGFSQHSYQLPAGSQRTDTDTVHLGKEPYSLPPLPPFHLTCAFLLPQWTWRLHPVVIPLAAASSPKKCVTCTPVACTFAYNYTLWVLVRELNFFTE